jgi:aryl-alcohol dehydrogenase-like predicted oxidoreductase
MAAARGVTPAQLAIAWARAKKPYIIPTVGARTRAQLDDALGALAITLTPAEVTELETVVPANAVAGSRYAEPLMKHLDSER